MTATPSFHMCFYFIFFSLFSHTSFFFFPLPLFFFTPTTSSRRVSNTTPEHTEISQLFILLKMVHTFCLNRSISVNIETIEDTVPPIVSFPPLSSRNGGSTNYPSQTVWYYY
ncbi:uncharacterized protein BO87DRAFT_62390 [Aspergillus neoniger CBS 115656]|uniref:Uncharacterized protein n=1 Tax=Aspergillus neoniger (strain CBS 115656) TaxID=1448310 RepID=A0A318ZCU2_ASPNB|nr:hypothetical protein BO87DRAFT_62390 [Aspergillus neoniger CBS 115656]PYH34072.1 hypothetical protein BO87DRAFT_62390 [Aspergillus neoniger CBS 115656]